MGDVCSRGHPPIAIAPTIVTELAFVERDGPSMMKTIAVAFTLTVLALASIGSARADEHDRQTILTFSQPVEIPGQVLPAGTYLFKLADSEGDRHIVQVFTADGSRIIATLMAIPDYRLRTSDQTVITFKEVPAGEPEAIQAWFYPGNNVGQEFVYPKSRAIRLARAAKTVVPALAADVSDVAALKTAPIVAITPDEQEVPVSAAIQTTPLGGSDKAANTAMVPSHSTVPGSAGTTGVAQTATPTRNARELPKTASSLPWIVFLGLASVIVAFAAMVFRKRSPRATL
jgi:LPXTG-motif cell wall-anchored protein